jgi:hypothetical protein
MCHGVTPNSPLGSKKSKSGWSDKPVKIININFFQSEYSFKSTGFQLFVIRNDGTHFFFANNF